jgi:hypothetical protein
MNNFQKFNSLGLEIPSILLPKNSSLQKWAVIACDQFTQDYQFWDKIKTYSSGSPSTLNLIFPEVFLPDGGAEARIKDIHSTMKRYMNEGVFDEPKHGFIYIERDTPFQKNRRGLIAAIDLEKYDWKDNSRPLIRCTEGTVPERLPPRMDIRRGAPLELPHVLLLIDDDTDSLLTAIAERVKKSDPVYNTPLMMNAGNVRGWFLDAQTDLTFIADKLDDLYNRSLRRYSGGKEPFLFAVGDGNHSLAAAKGIWEEYKAANGLKNHPCRYALVEIENIYDPAIQFEPIHRLIPGAGFDEIIYILSSLPHFSVRNIENEKDLLRYCERLPEADEYFAANYFGIICEGRYALIETSAAGIATACLQPLLDKKLQEDGRLSIDYIHDTEELIRLAHEKQAAGILLPPVKKSGLFETVAGFGPLPRKSFSMGHSLEKRFYLECRQLFS